MPNFLSIVIPAFNEEDNIYPIYNALKHELKEYEFINMRTKVPQFRRLFKDVPDDIEEIVLDVDTPEMIRQTDILDRIFNN